MTKEDAEKYIKSEMCKNCSVYLGGGKCSDNCKVIEAINALKQKSILDNISDEIEQIEINGHIRNVECFNAGINAALNVIDKYKTKPEDIKT